MLEHMNQKYFKLSVGELKKDTATEIACCCPHCGDTKDRLHLYNTEVGDLVHCFNSGCELSDKHHSVLNFLKIINSPYVSAYKNANLINRIDIIKSESSLQDILKKIKAEPAPNQHNQPEIPLDTLFDEVEKHPAAMEYLSKRNIKVPQNQKWYFSTQKFFTYNNKSYFLEDFILVPIYNKDYKYRGFYSRSIHEKRFSTFLLEGTEKIWVLEAHKTPDIICEGIFDALSTGFENPAAMLGSDLNREFLNTLPQNTIFAFDNDKTGTQKAIKYAKEGFTVFVWPESDEKDFNELSKTSVNIKELITNNLYRGFDAEVRLRMKTN